ncbi:hypothetical protein [Geomonas subterranea]|uniref:hypothetical protein n=1 Tax=Geomonas subterranea TaxID=2847989 RepID=UPI001CD38C26|nr:hypothetical protein [Geomonas fuzhouensis]
MQITNVTEESSMDRPRKTVEEIFRETILEADGLRAALSCLLSECYDRQGVFQQPSKAAVRRAILTLHTEEIAVSRYPDLFS